jgi:uncharacterized protein (TIGR00255 family)
MTGYGRVNQAYKDKTVGVEVRSLNSKYTDVRLKIPNNYKEKEPDIRRKVITKAERGKIEISIEIKSVHGEESFSLNQALFRKYYRELSKLAEELQMPAGDLAPAILRLPSVVASPDDEIEEAEWQAVSKTIDLAIEQFQKFRLAEGQAMEEDLRLRIDNIRSLLAEVDPHEETRIQKLRQRMQQNLEEYMGKENVDENRFEQEVLFYLEKIDITEEKVRLEQHCNYFIEELDKKITLKGRKLSFISQEMGREINTLGAKAYSSDIQRLVVSMKDELEKIKEQVANSM